MIDEMIVRDYIKKNKETKRTVTEYYKRVLKASLGLLTGVGVLFGGLLPLALSGTSKNASDDSKNKVSWDMIKSSYICETDDNNKKSLKILIRDYNQYYDVISNQKLHTTEKIISMSPSYEYFYNSDKIQNWYSQDELKEILESFKINSEYTISNDKVLIKK